MKKKSVAMGRKSPQSPFMVGKTRPRRPIDVGAATDEVGAVGEGVAEADSAS